MKKLNLPFSTSRASAFDDGLLAGLKAAREICTNRYKRAPLVDEGTSDECADLIHQRIKKLKKEHKELT